MYKLKSVAQRAASFTAAVSMLAGIGSGVLPALASADALNPLTERTLTLSSSSPGWSFTDGSGNSRYAGPNTGANGQKTGNTFTFRTSSDKTIQALTFQYCTASAGQCVSPGTDATATVPGVDDSAHSDLYVQTGSPVEVSGADYATLSANTTATATGAGLTGNMTAYGDVLQVPDGQDTVSPYDKSAFGGLDQSNGKGGNFVVLYGDSATGYVNKYSGGWNMTAVNQEEASGTTKPNMIKLIANGTTNTGLHLHPGDYVKVMFFGTDTNYITNPGEGAFFVKINTYDSTDYQNFADGVPLSGHHCLSDGTTYEATSPVADCKSNVIDGGVTVANVMNQSIQITTKVLETMDFSVGTVDPDTLTDEGYGGTATQSEYYKATGGNKQNHSECDAILNSMLPTDPANALTLGSTTAENSLETHKTYATHSYWRLSSNSSGGATVYYAGNTLSNTEGDEIAPIGTAKKAPSFGSEQFGLAIDNNNSGNYNVNYGDVTTAGIYENGADRSATSGGADTDQKFKDLVTTAADPVKAHTPQLAPLVPLTDYNQGAGVINGGSIDTKFAFDPNANTVPAAIATESSQVVNCVTAKMRYIGNIAAITPAGIYTTKINYIAAPQY
jgi:hypothetical protein